LASFRARRVAAGVERSVGDDSSPRKLRANPHSSMDYPGNLFAVAAPSGTGKSSLVKALLELDSHLVVSISHTTRKPRGQEQQGREYHFVDEPEFRR
jgi:ABC-type dipeptide/oligopeptide/nickel transport system ATPase subunit